MENEPDEVGLAAVFGALANDDRLAIVRALGERLEPLTVTALATTVGISRFSASRHLRVLCDAGVVVATRCGQSILHRLADSGLAPIEDWLYPLLARQDYGLADASA